MKKMLITLTEFVENGGILEKDRTLYVNDNDNVVGYYLGYDDKLGTHLMYNASYKSAPIHMGFLVEIEVKPIYK